MTRKWNIVDDNSNLNYAAENEITCDTEILRSNLCDYNNAYILVTGGITVVATPATQVAFKNCALFTKCITKVDGATIDDDEDLDLIMPMYNLIEYSSNYSETTRSLWFYSKDEATDFNADIVNDNNFKSFKCKAKLLGNIAEMPLINCKVELKLKWSNYYVLSAAGNNNANSNEDNIIFTIKDTKLYVPAVTLSVRDNQELTKLFSKEFEKSVYWKEYKTKTESKNKQMSIDIFSNQILLGLIDCLFYSI